MKTFIPETMTAAATDRYGGPEVLRPHGLPVPSPRGREVLIRLEAAGVGVWDADVRTGELELGKTAFPKVIGNDGAGIVAAAGKDVHRFKAGDRAYACAYQGGRIAHPNGVEPAPTAPAPGVKVIAYDGVPSREVFDRLNAWIASGPFHVELGQTYALEDAAQAHRELSRHHLGKRALRIHAH
jgi:NADPH:quinone reductase-like Zn-dependent oxidoreductase